MTGGDDDDDDNDGIAVRHLVQWALHELGARKRTHVMKHPVGALGLASGDVARLFAECAQAGQRQRRGVRAGVLPGTAGRPAGDGDWVLCFDFFDR